MKDFIFGTGRFIANEFDKILLVTILGFTIFKAQDSSQLSADIAKEAFAALLGFMTGRFTKPPTEPKV